MPADWVARGLKGSDARAWARLTISATPTGAKASQVGVIRASVLRAPAVFRTLELIMREAPTSGDGPWLSKAEYYGEQAGLALERALRICGGEFDTTGTADQVTAVDAAQTSAEASAGGWRMERG
jgi:hypothetical protein